MIHLSPKHGVNPAIPICYFCQKEKNEIVLPGRLPNDQEAPRRAVWDIRPCDECSKLMKTGVIFISVRDGEQQSPNPYRTGGWAVVKDEAVERWPIDDGLRKHILTMRFCFIEDAVWTRLGFPPLASVDR